jgi:hypothetical protein
MRCHDLLLILLFNIIYYYVSAYAFRYLEYWGASDLTASPRFRLPQTNKTCLLVDEALEEQSEKVTHEDTYTND